MSRPLIGAKPPSSADLSAEVAPLGSPRVIVGIPPSDPPPSNEPSSEAPSGAPDSIETKGPSTPNDPLNIALSKLPRIIDPLEALEKLESRPPPETVAKEIEEPAKIVELPTVAVGLLPAEEPKKVEASEKLEEKKEEPAKEETKEEKTEKTFASTLVFGSGKIEEPKPVETKRSFASTLAFGSPALDPSVKKELSNEERVQAGLLPKKEEPAVKAVELTKTQPMKMAPVNSLGGSAVNEAKLESPKRDEKKNKNDKNAKKDLEKSARAAGAEDPDEISVPPIGDVTVEKFFSEGHLSNHLSGHNVADVEDAALTIPDKIKRKADPVVAQRRARFARYVKWAVAGAAVVCMAAVARTTLTTSKASATALRNSASLPLATPEVKAAEPAATPTADPTTPPTVAAAADPTAAPAPIDSATPTDVVPTEEVTGDPKEEKKNARSLLEKRKIVEAIAAAEKSVALDPTDAEAWLLLGAAHQEKGEMVAARKAYASCVKEAKTGPRHECGKMLR